VSISQSIKDLDLQLEVMPEQNRKMLYGSVFLAFIGLFYYAFGISLKEEAQSQEIELQAIKQKLSENKMSLYENKISKTKKSILVWAKKFEDAKYQETSLRVRLEEIDFLSSDAKGLADILDRLLKNSVTLDVSIEKIILDDTVKDYKAQIKQRGTIHIEGSADFTSVLKLINFIESQEALLEVQEVHFSLRQKQKLPYFELKIRGYSIEL